MFKFHKERVNFERELGKGGFGKVYQYQKGLNDNKWVVKRMFIKNFQEMICNIQEVVLGFSCNNPYVLPVKGYQFDCPKEEHKQSGQPKDPEKSEKTPKEYLNVYIKLPRMDESLRDVIDEHKKQTKSIPEAKIIKYFYAITKGLQYLHGKGIAHRDIKPDNILLKRDKNLVRIADLGIGHYYGGQTTYNTVPRAGTLLYEAPENQEKIETPIYKGIEKADLWSLGMVIFELCTLANLGELNYLKHGANREAELASHIQKVKYSETLIELITKLLRVNPDERISLQDIEEILNNKYSESSELKELKEAARELLDSEAQKRIHDLEKELSERNSEIMTLREEYKRMMTEFEEYKKKTNRETEGTFELKEKMQEEYPQMGVEEESKQNKSKAEDDDELTLLKMQECLAEKWFQKFTFQFKGKKGIEIETEDKMVTNENVLEMMKDLTNTYKESSPEDLQFDLSRCGSITDPGLKDLAMQIGSSLINLKSLSLDFTGCKITETGLVGLAEQIGKGFINLQHLSLNFSGCQIENPGLEQLAMQIGRRPGLQHLSLNFLRCQIPGKGLKELVEQIKQLINLQHLSLNFSDCTLTERQIENLGSIDQGLKELVEQIEQLINLQHLSLNFSDCRGGRQGIKQLAMQIGRRPIDLQHLSLDFSGCEIADKELEELARQIGQRLNNLYHLSLNFSDSTLIKCKITDLGFEKLATQIGQRLSNFRHLSLDFLGCQVTDFGLKTLATEIGRRDLNLQVLSLAFGMSAITHQGLKELSKQIGQRLINLQCLSLKFFDCGITDEGIIELATQITQRPFNLRDLSLTFESSHITDQGLKGLTQQIGKRLLTLQRLSLDLRGQKQITDRELTELTLEIRQQLFNLQHLSLNFEQY